MPHSVSSEDSESVIGDEDESRSGTDYVALAAAKRRIATLELQLAKIKDSRSKHARSYV